MQKYYDLLLKYYKSFMDDKKQSGRTSSSKGLCDCIRLQLERSDLI